MQEGRKEEEGSDESMHYLNRNNFSILNGILNKLLWGFILNKLIYNVNYDDTTSAFFSMIR